MVRIGSDVVDTLGVVGVTIIIEAASKSKDYFSDANFLEALGVTEEPPSIVYYLPSIWVPVHLRFRLWTFSC